MQLPFSPDAFFDVFARYNLALWPVVRTLWLVAAAVLVAVAGGPPRVVTDRLAALLLVVLWLWSGAVYHALYFTAINPAAWVFAAFFVLEAGLLAWFGLLRNQLTFGSASPRVQGLGIALALYGLAYPVVNLALGHPYPTTPTFGVPCPTTLFTVGLLLTCHRPPVAVTLIPVLWSVIAGSAALSLGVPADLVLLACAVLLLAQVFLGRVRRPIQATPRSSADPGPTLQGRTP
jgi:hypothetical protein